MDLGKPSYSEFQSGGTSDRGRTEVAAQTLRKHRLEHIHCCWKLLLVLVLGTGKRHSGSCLFWRVSAGRAQYFSRGSGACVVEFFNEIGIPRPGHSVWCVGARALHNKIGASGISTRLVPVVATDLVLIGLCIEKMFSARKQGEAEGVRMYAGQAIGKGVVPSTRLGTLCADFEEAAEAAVELAGSVESVGPSQEGEVSQQQQPEQHRFRLGEEDRLGKYFSLGGERKEEEKDGNDDDDDDDDRKKEEEKEKDGYDDDDDDDRKEEEKEKDRKKGEEKEKDGYDDDDDRKEEEKEKDGHDDVWKKLMLQRRRSLWKTLCWSALCAISRRAAS